MLDVLLAIAVLDSGSDPDAVVDTLAGDGALTSMELGTNAVVEVKEFGVLDEACWTDVVTADLRLRGVATLTLGVFFGAAGNSFSCIAILL